MFQIYQKNAIHKIDEQSKKLIIEVVNLTYIVKNI